MRQSLMSLTYVCMFPLGLSRTSTTDKRSTATATIQFANIFALCTMHQRFVCECIRKSSRLVSRSVGDVVTLPFTILENLHAIINIRLDRIESNWIESHVGEPLWQMQKSFANDRHIFSIANIFQLLLKWLVVDGQVIGGNNYKWTMMLIALRTTALRLCNQIFITFFCQFFDFEGERTWMEFGRLQLQVQGMQLFGIT